LGNGSTPKITKLKKSKFTYLVKTISHSLDKTKVYWLCIKQTDREPHPKPYQSNPPTHNAFHLLISTPIT